MTATLPCIERAQQLSLQRHPIAVAAQDRLNTLRGLIDTLQHAQYDAMPYCAALCCAVLCCALPCRAMPCCAVCKQAMSRTLCRSNCTFARSTTSCVCDNNVVDGIRIVGCYSQCDDASHAPAHHVRLIKLQSVNQI